MIGHRHFAFAGHVAIEFLIGVALAASPFVFDFDEGAMIAALVLGALIATMALSTSVSGYSISAHHGWDRGVVALLLVAAVVAAIAGVGIESVVFLAAALCEGVLLAITRYSAEPR